MVDIAGRTALVLILWAAAVAAPAQQSIDFGDDSGEFARDGECDDRRFFGATMASALSLTEIGRDATDCRRGFEAGTLELWDMAAARAATDCAATTFGDDSSEFARDGECDDIRFEGIGAAALLLPGDTFRDATDCRRLCEFGVLFLRDYD